MMHKLIILIRKCLQEIDTFLCEINLKRPEIVVVLDGGICSQIFNYIKGARFADAGYKVMYDIRWFNTNGKDLTGKFCRKYELQEMFPNLPIQIVPACVAQKWYARFFRYNQCDNIIRMCDIKRTTYLDSHYAQDKETYKRLFPIFFNEYTMQQVEVPWIKRAGTIHCGVHVRRGDLATQRQEYGMVSEGYFKNAIEYVKSNYQEVTFHFFSDEMDWVEQNILPKVQIEYDLVQGNKAWQDLALLSKCDVIIASQGSFGRMAAQLKEHAEIIICKTDLVSDYLGRDTHVTLID